MILHFEQDLNTGTCFTPCPYGFDCMVYSYKCTKCKYYFGEHMTDVMAIRCTGARHNYNNTGEKE